MAEAVHSEEEYDFCSYDEKDDSEDDSDEDLEEDEDDKDEDNNTIEEEGEAISCQKKWPGCSSAEEQGEERDHQNPSLHPLINRLRTAALLPKQEAKESSVTTRRIGIVEAIAAILAGDRKKAVVGFAKMGENDKVDDCKNKYDECKSKYNEEDETNDCNGSDEDSEEDDSEDDGNEVSEEDDSNEDSEGDSNEDSEGDDDEDNEDENNDTKEEEGERDGQNPSLHCQNNNLRTTSLPSNQDNCVGPLDTFTITVGRTCLDPFIDPSVKARYWALCSSHGAVLHSKLVPYLPREGMVSLLEAVVDLADEIQAATPDLPIDTFDRWVDMLKELECQGLDMAFLREHAEQLRAFMCGKQGKLLIKQQHVCRRHGEITNELQDVEGEIQRLMKKKEELATLKQEGATLLSDLLPWAEACRDAFAKLAADPCGTISIAEAMAAAVRNRVKAVVSATNTAGKPGMEKNDHYDEDNSDEGSEEDESEEEGSEEDDGEDDSDEDSDDDSEEEDSDEDSDDDSEDDEDEDNNAEEEERALATSQQNKRSGCSSAEEQVEGNVLQRTTSLALKEGNNLPPKQDDDVGPLDTFTITLDGTCFDPWIHPSVKARYWALCSSRGAILHSKGLIRFHPLGGVGTAVRNFVHLADSIREATSDLDIWTFVSWISRSKNLESVGFNVAFLQERIQQLRAFIFGKQGKPLIKQRLLQWRHGEITQELWDMEGKIKRLMRKKKELETLKQEVVMQELQDVEGEIERLIRKKEELATFKQVVATSLSDLLPRADACRDAFAKLVAVPW